MGRNTFAAARMGEPRIRTLDFSDLKAPPELGQVDPDPANMARLKVTSEPRAVERPDAVWDQLEQVTPQFFLRNTERLERYADEKHLDYLEWRAFRDTTWWDDLDAAHRCSAERADIAPVTATQAVLSCMAEQRVLVVETRWHEHFGRPDPVG